MTATETSSARAEPVANGRPLCRHCDDLVACKPRGLCWRCYNTPGIRERYEPSKFAARGEEPQIYNPPLPAAPTSAPPGSPEKVAVLESRFAAGCALYHPLDADRVDEFDDDATERLMICETCQIEMPVRSGRFHCRRCGRLVWLGQSYVPSLAHDYAVLDQAIVKIARHLRTLLEAVAASSVDSVLFQEMRTDVDRILESLKPAETAS